MIISTSCYATGVLWVSKEAENCNKANHFSLMLYFSPKPEKTSKSYQKMSIFSSFLVFTDFFILDSNQCTKPNSFNTLKILASFDTYIILVSVQLKLEKKFDKISHCDCDTWWSIYELKSSFFLHSIDSCLEAKRL